MRCKPRAQIPETAPVTVLESARHSVMAITEREETARRVAEHLGIAV
jgi:hypothetical protein